MLFGGLRGDLAKEHDVENQNGVGAGLIDMWRNPDTGAKLQVSGEFRIRVNTAEVDAFEQRCIGGPTILP